MRHFSLYRYELPINSGLILRGQQQKTRSGLICHLQEDKKEGWGEISPLIGFSQETLAQAQAQANGWLEGWQQNQTHSLENLSPSVAFGLSMALQELSSPFPALKNIQTVPLCSDSSPATIQRLHQSSAKIAKLKVGRHSPQEDAQNVQLLLKTCPMLSLRLDANQAWELDAALAFARQLSPQEKQRIQFIEEPCQTSEQSLIFAKLAEIGIAWDESIQMDNTIRPAPLLKAIVLKPTLIGSLEKCQRLIEQAQKLGVETIISSSIETSLGLSQLAQIAEKFTPNTPAGLDTLSLMQHQLLRPLLHSSLPLLGINSPYLQKICEK